MPRLPKASFCALLPLLVTACGADSGSTKSPGGSTSTSTPSSGSVQESATSEAYTALTAGDRDKLTQIISDLDGVVAKDPSDGRSTFYSALMRFWQFGDQINLPSNPADVVTDAQTMIDRFRKAQAMLPDDDRAPAFGGLAKVIMGNTFGDLPAPSDGAMLEAFEIIARLGKRIVVHAENPSIMARRQGQLEKAGRADVVAHLQARPAICEIEAVSRAIHFAEWTGARLHIAHKSSKDALDIVRQAKARGVDVTVETCPQYLLLDTTHMAKLGNVMRVNPPIREPGHAEPLWQALRDGVVDMLATDHAPHSIPEKTAANVWQCCSGFPGVETAVPLMLTEVAAGRISLAHYVKLTAMAPAKAWGLYPRKGALQVGSDADIAIVDLKREGRISAADLHSKSKITPFEGRAVRGVPVATLVRGTVVARDGQVVGSPGWGKPVAQAMAAPAPRNADWTSAAIVRPPRF